MSIPIISRRLIIMTCYEVRHSPLIRDQRFSHWTVDGEWGHGICHRWCRWGYLHPFSDQALYPPLWPFYQGPQPTPPMLQSQCILEKNVMGSFVRYRSGALTISSYRKLTEETVKQCSIPHLISNWLIALSHTTKNTTENRKEKAKSRSMNACDSSCFVTCICQNGICFGGPFVPAQQAALSTCYLTLNFTAL